jgi:hypothetical protein
MPDLTDSERLQILADLNHLLPFGPINKPEGSPLPRQAMLNTVIQPREPRLAHIAPASLPQREHDVTPMLKRKVVIVPDERLVLPSIHSMPTSGLPIDSQVCSLPKKVQVSSSSEGVLPSILLSKSNRKAPLKPVCSVASDIPSLASISSADSLAGIAGGEEEHSRRVSFNPRVWVRIFHRPKHEDIWYSQDDMDRFKLEAIQQIQRHNTKLIPTGTGRMVHATSAMPSQKLLFSHTALQTVDEGAEPTIQKAAPIQRVLVVNPHDICLKLLKKSFELILPHANVTTVMSTSEVLQLVKSTVYDIIVVEERMQRFDNNKSGVELLRQLNHLTPLSLLIGLSSQLQCPPADVVWSKPPPKMDQALLQDLVLRVKAKRDRQ